MPTDRARSAGSARPLFRPSERVAPNYERGPRFADDIWDFTSIHHSFVAERAIHWARFPSGYRLACKEVLMGLANPTHPMLVQAGVVRRDRPIALASLHNEATMMLVIAEWGVIHGLERLQDWKQDDADRFKDDLGAGTHKEGGDPLGRNTIAKYVNGLKRFREFSQAISDGGFTFMPWGARSATNVGQAPRSVENATRPMPWQMWAPLVAGAWQIVSRFSDDILTAKQAFEALPKQDSGPSGPRAAIAVREWLAAGNKVPLHTGYGLEGARRGLPNYALLCRLIPVRPTFLKRTHNAYQPETVALIASLAARPEHSVFGGLATPTALAAQHDGSTSPWIDEVGVGEAVHLTSVLRAACYILIAALTGMRDSEIQDLRRGCLGTADDVTSITGVQHKGVARDEGQERIWWAPEPVVRVIQVLERLSPNPTLLFARSAADRSVYQYLRDVPRLVDFINSDPAIRHGRGRGLGLEAIDCSSATPINQLTLRRSFAVYAAQHPTAELGLGIQLGHAALRMTSGYARDSQEQAVKMFDDERTRAVRQQVKDMLTVEDARAAGAAAQEVSRFRGQVVADPGRAAHVVETLAERYHVGTFNDCVFVPDRAACGPDGPHLASHHCATVRCTNALFLNRHLPTAKAQMKRIDEWLARGIGHRTVREQLQDDRERLAGVVDELEVEAEP